MWKLESERGQWHTPRFQFAADLRRPDLGWNDLLVDGQPWNDRLFQIKFPGEQTEQAILDCYVRQADLIVTYTQSPDRTVRPQIVWRALRDDARVGVEAVLSMQTSLLDSEPKFSVSHQLASGELLALVDDNVAVCRDAETYTDPTVLLHRPEGSQQSLVIATYPSDFQRLAVSSAPHVATLDLFPDSLEKGVIRRARMRAIFVPRENDEQWAKQCLDELEAASPPLTA